MSAPHSVQTQHRVVELSPIARLPTELLVATFRLVLPSLGALNYNGQCQEYMAYLYDLRSVSKHWRRVIDETSILWRLISSTLPVHINARSVSRSLNTSLAVIYDATPPNENIAQYIYPSGAAQSDRSFAQSFAEWADIVRPRWSSVSFKLAPSTASILLAKPAPQLQNLTILLYQRSLASIPHIDLFGGCTEKIRHVKIDRVEGGYVHVNCIPMFWPSGAFQGLKSLHLGHVCGASLTTRYILEVLGASPELETLTLNRNAIQSNPSDMKLPQVILPCLQTLHYKPNYNTGVDHTLRHVTLSPDSIKNFSVTDYASTSEQTSKQFEDFLTTVLTSHTPVLGRLYERCGGPSFRLHPSAQRNKIQVSLNGRLENVRLRLFLPPISPSVALQWVDGALRLTKPGITLTFPEECLGGDTVSTMQFMQRVEKLLLHDCFRRGLPRVKRLLDAIGKSNSASLGLPGSATFPSLHTLTIAGWEMKLDPIISMLRARFSKASGLGTAGRVPDLLLELPIWDWVWSRDSGPENIRTWELVQGIKAMPGVKGVRLGQVSIRFRAGILAVVWDEELKAPVWG